MKITEEALKQAIKQTTEDFSDHSLNVDKRFIGAVLTHIGVEIIPVTPKVWLPTMNEGYFTVRPFEETAKMHTWAGSSYDKDLLRLGRVWQTADQAEEEIKWEEAWILFCEQANYTERERCIPVIRPDIDDEVGIDIDYEYLDEDQCVPGVPEFETWNHIDAALTALGEEGRKNLKRYMKKISGPLG